MESTCRDGAVGGTVGCGRRLPRSSLKEGMSLTRVQNGGETQSTTKSGGGDTPESRAIITWEPHAAAASESSLTNHQLQRRTPCHAGARQALWASEDRGQGLCICPFDLRPPAPGSSRAYMGREGRCGQTLVPWTGPGEAAEVATHPTSSQASAAAESRGVA